MARPTHGVTTMYRVGKMLGIMALITPFVAFTALKPVTARAQWETAFVEVEQGRGLPARGESRDSVRRKFGEPSSSRPAVGRPPISSWAYPDFTVYFEYDLVITTVATSDSLPTRLNDIQ